MNDKQLFQGSLFSEDFLCESVIGMSDWKDIDEEKLDQLEEKLRDVFTAFLMDPSTNEIQTEDDLIGPVHRFLPISPTNIYLWKGSF